MSTYTLASRGGLLAVTALVLSVGTPARSADATGNSPVRYDLAQRTFESACNSCHYRGADRAPFGRRSPLGANNPDEAAQFVLFGKAPEPGESGMPAFGSGFGDEEVSGLLVWMRSSAVPGKPWTDVAASVSRMRSTGARED